MAASSIALENRACFEVNGSTALTGTLEAAAGQMVVATVSVRSTPTYPAGWTLLAESSDVTASSGTKQRMAVLYRRVTQDETVSFAMKQSSSSRIYLNLLAFSGVTTLRWCAGAEYLSSATVASFTVQRPEGEVFLWCLSAIVWKTTAPYGTWACNGSSEGMISLDQASTQPRQANLLDWGEPGNRTFSQESQSPVVCECIQLLGEEVRHLVESQGVFYTVEDGALVPLEAVSAVSAAVFTEYGCEELPGAALLSGLTCPAVYRWTSGGELEELTGSVTATPPDQPVVAVCDMSHESILGIASLAAAASGTIGVSLSMDGGVTYGREQTLTEFLAADPAALWDALPENRRLLLRLTLHDSETLTSLQMNFVN